MGFPKRQARKTLLATARKSIRTKQHIPPHSIETYLSAKSGCLQGAAVQANRIVPVCRTIKNRALCIHRHKLTSNLLRYACHRCCHSSPSKIFAETPASASLNYRPCRSFLLRRIPPWNQKRRNEVVPLNPRKGFQPLLLRQLSFSGC